MGNIKIDDSARLVGKIRLGNGTYIAQGTVLRSKDDSILIENDSWILENSVLIGTKKNPLKIGSKTVFGHKVIAIGSEIGDLCEVGNCTIFLPGSKIGSQCIFGEGTIISENAIVPDGSVVVGRPGRVIRKLTEDDKKMISRMRGNNISLNPFIENIIDNDMNRGDIVGKIYDFNGKYPRLPKRLIYTIQRRLQEM
jgi:carbonic anhydrase/acetyltransferase-like protein (isoleucine patch superfamily)